MSELVKLPNIGKTLAVKLEEAGIHSCEEFVALGSENIALRLSTISDHGLCLNMLYALEGAVQGVRWHGLPGERKQELKAFYQELQAGLKKV